MSKIMFACSAIGEKLKPLVIGKAPKPCFKIVKVHKLPVTWDGFCQQHYENNLVYNFCVT